MRWLPPELHQRPRPCGRCRACADPPTGHPDITLVESEQDGGTLKVEQVRDLPSGPGPAPLRARYRRHLAAFSRGRPTAQNALLKDA
jgi:hypothetical protein